MSAGRTEVPKGDAVALTQALTRIDSRNPTLAPGAPGEGPIASALSHILSAWGFDVTVANTASGRPNVVARIGPANTPAMMFAGHLDTVGVEGMTHPPFDAAIEGDRLYGRGSADMKSGVAAMCCAALAAFEECGSDAKRQIVVAAVTDEEYESIGMLALIATGVTAECAILTEPTRLAINPAHRGFVWMEIEFTGRAAHGSRHDIGIDAIRHAGLVLAELDELDAGKLRTRSHSLLGRGSLHASTISGGTGLSTYPDRCVLKVERRTIPGETADDALREVDDALEAVRARRPGLSATVRLIGAQLPSDVGVDAPVVKMLERGLKAAGMPVAVEGMSAWTDAALLNEAGITAICFGPGDIGLAHAAEEYVPVSEIRQATAVLTHVGREWMMETA
ncbi:MAG TPA: ArgE/DapE family deacylase [Gemmatimonadaceae bacterium]|nr:ArgE/DapE family deacylase [Gemmatimonadaceae bacterium]